MPDSQVSASIDDELRDWLMAVAKAEHRSLSSMIAVLLREARDARDRRQSRSKS